LTEFSEVRIALVLPPQRFALLLVRFPIAAYSYREDLLRERKRAHNVAVQPYCKPLYERRSSDRPSVAPRCSALYVPGPRPRATLPARSPGARPWRGSGHGELLGGRISGNPASTTFVDKAASVSAPARGERAKSSPLEQCARIYGEKGGENAGVEVQDAPTNEVYPTAHRPRRFV